jgi:tetratricopeptide (TPR) repeat protein
VAYETLSRRDRKARHLAVAAHLRASFDADGEEVVDVIARHYLDALAAVPGDPDSAQIRRDAIAALVRAGERALRSGAPRAASSQFAAAARLATETGSDDADLAGAQLLERAAAALTLAGGGSEVLPLVDEAISMYDRHGDRRAAARVNAIGGAALWDVRRYREGRERLNTALAVLREQPDRDTVTALSELASIESLTASDDADKVSAEALVLGQQLDVDLRQLATLFIVRGIAVTFNNRAHEALAYLEYAIRIAEQAGDGATLGRAYLNKSTLLLSIDPASAAAAARASADHLRRVGASSLLAVAAMNLVNALLLVGDWDGAEALINEAAENDGIGDTEPIVLVRILVSALRGDVSTAGATATRGNLRDTEDLQNQAYLVVGEIAIAWATGSADEAARHVRELARIADAIGLRHETVAWGWPLAIRAAETLDHDNTAELLRMLDKHPPGDVPPLLRAERRLTDARRQPDGAATSFAAALDTLRRFGSPYHLAHGLLDTADHHLRQGESARAVPLVDEAAAIARALRATPLLARAEQLHAELSHLTSA